MNENSKIVKEIDQALKYINNGEFEEAILFLNKLEHNKNLNDSDINQVNLIKSSAFNKTGQFALAFKLAENAYKNSQKFSDPQSKLDALINLTWALSNLGDLKKSYNILSQSKDLLMKLYQKSSFDYQKREAYIFLNQAHINFYQGDAEKGLVNAQKGLELSKIIDEKFGVARAYYLMGILNIFINYDLESALKYSRWCQMLAEEMHFDFLIATNLIALGSIYVYEGDLDQGLILHEKALKHTNVKMVKMSIFNNIGNIHIQKGDLDKALDSLRKALELAEEVRNFFVITHSLHSIVYILVLQDQVEEARKYLKKLEKIKNKEQNKISHYLFLFSQALILKKNPRIQNRAKAQEILEKIVNQDAISGEIKITALLNLCDLLLDELNMTKNPLILKELKPIISKLLDTAESTHSMWFLSETYLLEAKLALIELDIRKARKVLTKSQEIAESHGLNLLAGKISQEHDNLLKQMDLWKELEKSKAPLQERFELSDITDLIESMVKKRRQQEINIIEEIPVSMFIITEGGTTLFSHSFVGDENFSSHIFGGFITTIDYFVREMFSEGLERAMFGEYTLIIKSIEPFFVSYIFKGDSYYAHLRLKYFVRNLKKESKIWEYLMENFNQSKSIKLIESPLLDSLLKNLFLDKKVELKGI
ncbi:MAG: tetratricopeptide repeat protein [Promethearchaeota archaeon]